MLMSFKLNKLVPLVLTSAALILSCVRAEVDVREGKGRGTVIVTEASNGRTLVVRKGDVLMIELSGNPSTGFWWHFVKLDREYLDLIAKETKPLRSDRPLGAPVVGVWYLKARKRGESILEMAYYRPWEGREKATRQFLIFVRIR